MHNLKIVQVMAGGADGGAETAFVDMCIALHQAGVQQIVITRKNALRNARLKAAGLTVHTLPFGGMVDIYTKAAMKKIIASFAPHIVQTWMSRAAVKTPHASYGQYLKFSRLGGYYAPKYFKTTDYFQTITPDIKNYLVAEGFAENKIRHINNFAETESDFKKLNRAQLNTPEQAFVLLALSRLHTAKALDVLIRAVEDMDDVHVWLAGEGPERGALQNLAQQLGIEKRIHFLGWRDDRAALLDACDVCVFPSRYEPFGTVFVQAWAAQKPLICSKAKGPAQFVQDGADGLMFDIDDVAGLKNAIISIRQNPEKKALMVAAGFKRYQAEFTKQACVAAYLQYYRQALAENGINLP